MDPEISIIVPTLNEEKYLEATLGLLSKQNTSTPYEIIILDGGSEDSTFETS